MGRRKGQIAAMSNLQLVKDRQRRQGRPVGGQDSFLHTTEMDDGTTYNRINFQSVTEQSNLEDFLTTAEMAGRDFTAERQAIQIITNANQSARLTKEDLHNISEAQETHKALLQIPRRPAWDKSTTKEELLLAERDTFTDWRRQLKMLEEEEHIQLTPYEKNLDFWRQLWRVIERSDVIVQIVDARNPLLFRCEDLETYVRQVDPQKRCMLLVNKADFLTQAQRQQWVDHFNKVGITAVFFSAKMEQDKIEPLSETSSQTMMKDKEGIDISSSEEEEDDEEEELSDSCDNEAEKESLEKKDPDKDEDEFDPDIVAGDNLTDEGRLTEGMASLQVGADAHRGDGDASVLTSKSALDSRPCEGLASDSTENKPHLDQNSTDMTALTHQPSDKNVKASTTETTTSDLATDITTENTSTDIFKEAQPSTTAEFSKNTDITNSPDIVSSDELLDIFRSLAGRSARCQSEDKEAVTVKTVGMVGYPNVGKSSTINVILEQKRLAVSATPGRTKHLQTLHVDPQLVLCDCPGLVFPSFVATKAHLVINGILPIDELRNHVPPVSLVCEHIPRHVLEATYSVMIPRPSLDDLEPNRPPTADELLNAYGAMRGFMTQRGVPDCPRASRYILKDYVKGKLLYCEPPPGVEGSGFQDFARYQAICLDSTKTPAKAPLPQINSDIDKEFFNQKNIKAHSRGVRGVTEYVRSDTLQQTGRGSEGGEQGLTSGQWSSTASVASQATSQAAGGGKPWKKHNNRNKKEKLRRLHRHLDV